MKKKILIIILSIVLCLSMLTYYLICINGTSEFSLYFSSQDALSKLKHEGDVLLDYSDDSFRCIIREEGYFSIAKKRLLSWVVQERHHPDTNFVSLLSNSGNLYVYGILTHRDASSVRLNNQIMSPVEPIEFAIIPRNGFEEQSVAFLFKLESPQDEISLAAQIYLIDENDFVISNDIWSKYNYSSVYFSDFSKHDNIDISNSHSNIEEINNVFNSDIQKIKEHQLDSVQRIFSGIENPDFIIEKASQVRYGVCLSGTKYHITEYQEKQSIERYGSLYKYTGYKTYRSFSGNWPPMIDIELYVSDESIDIENYMMIYK